LDIIFHFAGVNKSNNHNDFKNINTNFTKKLCKVLANNPKTRLFYASSIQVFLNNDYGKSKKEAEEACIQLMKKSNNQVYILRLPGIFGEGCKPNYNSVVSTFCFNIANNVDLQITNPNKEIELIYISDLCSQLNYLISTNNKESLVFIENKYKISIEDLAKTIKGFKSISKEKFFSENRDELKMKLFKTYLSFKN
jgi:UDP-2-acetamido-2,6-beta-L-arabino-hexul-4-ose reductase